jgi:hypothetical protein
MISGTPEDTHLLSDAIQLFLESVNEQEILAQVYVCLQKLLATAGPKHALFKNLVVLAKTVVSLFYKKKV